MTRTLVLGGARSGKSAHAERLAAESGKEVVYIATAQASDAEMSMRIEHHRLRRDARWATVEEPLKLAAAIVRHDRAGRLLLVDCLTVWLSNLLFAGRGDSPDYAHFPDVGPIAPPPLFDKERAALLDTLDHMSGDLILVSNEVGMGIVPQGAVSRWFTDEAGRLNQAVAARCDRALFIAAGLPLVLKG